MLHFHNVCNKFCFRAPILCHNSSSMKTLLAIATLCLIAILLIEAQGSLKKAEEVQSKSARVCERIAAHSGMDSPRLCKEVR